MYNANQMVDRLILCGLSRSESAQVMATVDRWCDSNGVEWTVKHLKLIKQTIIGLYGLDTKCVSPYVKTKNGSLVGPFRAIQRLFELGQTRALAAMMIYSSYVAYSLTKEQEAKFKNACTAPAYTGGWLPSLTSYTEVHDKNVAISARRAQSHKFHGIVEPNLLSRVRLEIDGLIGSAKTGHKMAPDYKGVSFDESDLSRSVDSFWRSELYRELYFSGNGFFPEDWDFLAGKVLGFELPPPLKECSFPIGKVSILQEPGFKARFIANPNRVVQILLKPLGDMLFSCLQLLPTDCTFNQDKATEKLQEALRSKSRVYCFDLTNATDYFPLEIQEQVVMNLFHDAPFYEELLVFLRLFRACARSSWYMGTNKEHIRWSRGQPLGVYPSFAYFALAHNMIIKELQTHHGGEFYVLGDDVVIIGENLANSYKSLMEELGVVINMSKSLTSDLVGEFAGKVILRSDILVPYKWRQTSLSSVRDFLVMWGIEGLPLLPRHLREWAALLASLPEPVGLGYNPQGLSIEWRVLNLWYLYIDEELPPLSAESESLINVLRVMPEGSKLRYDNDSSISRPVRLPLKTLAPYLCGEDLRGFYEDLVSRGILQKDAALREVRDFGYHPETTSLDNSSELERVKSIVKSRDITLKTIVMAMFQTFD